MLYSGCASLWMIIMIGYDRYNVIVKGFSGVKITPCIALLMITFSFAYSTGVCIVPFFEVWGSYKLGMENKIFIILILITLDILFSSSSEGLLLTCSFDYLTETVNNMSFTAFFFTFCYLIPLLFIIFFYSQIVMAVVSHERALKAQAKKMNVESLRSNEVVMLHDLLKNVAYISQTDA